MTPPVASSIFIPTVLVTGVSRGIGFGIAKALLANHGACVVGMARSSTNEIEELKKLGGGRYLHIEGDVTSVEGVKKAVEQTVSKFGGLDSVVLNAGVLTPIRQLRDCTDQATVDAFAETYNINTLSNVSLLAVAIPHLSNSKMPGGPKVVFVSSGAAQFAISGWASYCSSKAAQWSLCQQLHKEEPQIVSVAIKPGVVDTFMQDTIRSDVGKAGMPDSQRQMFLDFKSNEKLGDPMVVGAKIAQISLTCPKELSGQIVDHTDERFN